MRYLSNARIPSTPTLRNISGSSRPVARSSEIDFDDIPSPRPRKSISRVAKAGPSSLSTSVTARNFEPDSDSDNEPADYGNYGDDMDVSGMENLNGDYGAEDSPPPPSPPQRSSPRRKSFAQIDQEMDGPDEDETEVDEPEEPPPESPPRMEKGKRKAHLEDIQEEDEAVEEEIAQGLNDVEQYDSEGEEEREPSPPPKKKQKVAEKDRPKKNTSSKSKKENWGESVFLLHPLRHQGQSSEPRDGVRRSKRERFKPLEWWRGEKVVYGRTNSSGPILVPTIKEIRRIPTDTPQPLGKHKRGFNRARSKTVDRKAPPAVYNPEEGWDDATDPFGEVYDIDKQALVVRRMYCSII